MVKGRNCDLGVEIANFIFIEEEIAIFRIYIVNCSRIVITGIYRG